MTPDEVDSELNNSIAFLEAGIERLQAVNSQITALEPTDRENLTTLQAQAAQILKECEQQTVNIPELVKSFVLLHESDYGALEAMSQRLKPLLDVLAMEKGTVGAALMKMTRGRSSISAYTQATKRY